MSKNEIVDVLYYEAAGDNTGWPRVWAEVMSDGSARAVHNTEIGPGVYVPQVNGWDVATKAHEDAGGFFVTIISTHCGNDEDDNISAALLSGMRWLGYDGEKCPDAAKCAEGCYLNGRCPYENKGEQE